ncbi:MAG: dihydroorotate dehydrogenase-like protein [Planctomycetota bacterium]|jgi:dihydroorotate dehydrogenase (fumarate)
MDLSTSYLGLQLPHPFMGGASPLADTMDGVKRLQDAGTAAIVLRSLFEEQIAAEGLATQRSIEEPAESFAEATSYFPRPDEFVFGPHEYLEQIRKIKQAVNVPVIASLNGSTRGGWLDYAKLMQQAGADALELNVYYLATKPDESGKVLVQETIDMVAAVKKAVNIPVAVKISAYYSSVANVAKCLDEAGADGLILFNRFYQPDIDVEQLEVVPSLSLSNSGALLLRLRWLAILSGRIKADLAVTGGVHTPVDAVKAVMCGAHAVQMVSALLEKGPAYLKAVREETTQWLETHEYESLKQMQGSMGLTKCPDPKAFERANYMHVLQSWPAR